ncbi:MAG: undecaprenyl-diphosphate phosphatase [Clostridia bacterium]|nr:undecaprenyl-diphosphate phosphatase [Clostridia bacterium]
MIEILKSVFLGIVQGLTEFLPVSSSGHLNIMPWLFKWDNISESFDLALHAGTLLAILIYFYKDWIALIGGGVKMVAKKEKSTEGKIFWYIVAATVPAGVLGLILEKVIEFIVGDNLNLEMIIIAAALIIMGIILYLVDKRCKADVAFGDITFKKALLIGASQAIAAAIPGTSRSGITMTVSRSLGLDRESAAKFSFLLSAPIVAAAVLLSIGEFAFSVEFFAGVLASFVSGMLVIKFLMSYLKKGSYKIFAVYRVIFGLFIIITAIIRI